MGDENGLKKPGHRYSEDADDHLEDLTEKLKGQVKVVALKKAESSSTTRPVEVTATDMESAFLLIVKGFSRVEHYRFWHTVVSFFSGIGMFLVFKAVVETDSARWPHGVVGALMIIVAYLVDAYLLDSRS